MWLFDCCLFVCFFFFKDTKADELHTLGMRCRGERHELIIARQKEALAELRGRTKTLEQLKPPRTSFGLIFQICQGMQVIRCTPISTSVTKCPLTLWVNFNIACDADNKCHKLSF